MCSTNHASVNSQAPLQETTGGILSSSTPLELSDGDRAGAASSAAAPLNGCRCGMGHQHGSAPSNSTSNRPIVNLGNALPQAAPASIDGEVFQLEQASSFNITFDFRFDTNGFFDSAERRNTLEAAASIWESLILDEFDDLPPGIPLTLFDPQTGDLIELETDFVIDDLVIFVGARDLDGPIALGGPSGFGPVPADSPIVSRIGGDDFEPFAGTIAFEEDNPWFFDQTPDTADDVPANQDDFLSITLHEIGHVLGFGTSDAFSNLTNSDGIFTGANATEINNGEPVPIIDDFHFPDGFTFNGQATLLDPSITVGTRVLPTPIDSGVLADIGFQIVEISEDDVAPEISAGQAIAYVENQTADFQLGTITAEDDVAVTSFDIASGDEAGFFDIDDAGLLSLTPLGSTAAANDFETTPNTFTLGITASDAAGNVSAIVAVEIAVTDDLTDNPNVAPNFTSPAAVNALENSTLAAIVTAEDPNNDPLTYSIIGGDDGAAFSIDPVSGTLTFLTAPDFETPGDADGDNLFVVELAVTDNTSEPATQTLEISVANDPFEDNAEFTLDSDSNGDTDALTDGLNVLRVLLGAPVQSIVLGENVPNGVTQESVATGLSNASIDLLLDVDSNGAVDPVTDGLNILRVLLGAPAQSIVLGENTPAGVTQETVIADVTLIS